MKVKSIFMGVSLCAIALLSVGAQAAAWEPKKPVKIIVAFSPGGDTDVSARVYSEELSKHYGTPFVVENRTGASGMLGTAFVANAKPDGYTLLYTNNTMPILPHIIEAKGSTQYDPIESFVPIIRDQTIPMVFAASKGSGIKSVADIIQQQKENVELHYATPGTGTPMHVVGELLNEDAQINLKHVPYRGSAPAVADAVSGHVPLVWATPGVLQQYFKSGDLIPLAVADAERTALLPDVPTLKELGYENGVVTAWEGFLGPKGMPQEIAADLYESIKNIAEEEATVQRFKELGLEVNVGTSEEFAQQIAYEYDFYGDLLKKYNIIAK